MGLVRRGMIDYIGQFSWTPGRLYRIQLTHLPVLDHGPLEALHIYAQSCQCREEDDGLDANLLALIVFGFSRPAQESCDVLGHLRSRCRST